MVVTALAALTDEQKDIAAEAFALYRCAGIAASMALRLAIRVARRWPITCGACGAGEAVQ